mmetsp:Transcript_19152/g.37842  ORF Transcript_19152/g.37842 Transcript_19152/m.37842 type:complete len:81 (-) Transcript_19152:115-357(-)
MANSTPNPVKAVSNQFPCRVQDIDLVWRSGELLFRSEARSPPPPPPPTSQPLPVTPRSHRRHHCLTVRLQICTQQIEKEK